jgi:DNA helicase II / ATP-dependent DNA helicase PcrA
VLHFLGGFEMSLAATQVNVPSHLHDLNPEQLAAVRHHTGPLLILAGAGSGKTRVLTRRVVNLVLEYGERPDNILAVTFTNKAADEMKSRLRQLLGQRSEQLWVSTFHSAGLRILRRHASLLKYPSDFGIYDDSDVKGLMREILREEGIDEKKFSPSSFLNAIDNAKNNFLTPEDLLNRSTQYIDRLQAEIYQKYQQRLFDSKAMDFGDLLMNPVRILKQYPEVRESYNHYLHFVLVDEFQDTNFVQYLFIRLLTQKRRNLLVVGDDDQSIYAFRGATIRNILDFERDFPETKVIKLEQNYRSTGNILEAAHAVIEPNTERKPKKLWTDQGRGGALTTYVAWDESQEANFVAQEIYLQQRNGVEYKDMAIFYRTNAQSRALEEALLSYQIPYRIYGGLKFYDRKEIKDIIGYLRLLSNLSDSQAFLRVINTPARGIGDQTVNSLKQYARENQQSLWEATCVLAERSRPLGKFVELITDLSLKVETAPMPELIDAVLDKTEYLERLKTDKSVVTQSRIENVKELRALTSEYGEGRKGLQQFLDRVSLTSSAEVPHEESKEKDTPPNMVSLMTLHLAKGLEFSRVFFTGLEEGLLPHYRSIEEGNIEEERRLCYVGITRARQKLYLTRSVRRGMFSARDSFATTGQYREPSRFIFDIPPAVLDQKGGDFSASFSIKIEDNWRDSDEEYFDEIHYEGEEKPSRKSPVGPGVRFKSIKTADQLLSDMVSEDPNRVLASFQEIQVGTRVNHPTFGDGMVKAVDHADGRPTEEAKIVVRFDSQKIGEKRLVFKLVS